MSGPFTGTSFFEFTTHGCSFVYQAFDLTYETAKGGTGTFHADTCGALGDPPTVTGTFVLTTAYGATLAGAVNGTICFGCPPLFDPTANIFAGTITGTVEGSRER